MPQHPAVQLVTCWGERQSIDALMVPLVSRLWERGVLTNGCCQGDPGGRASILFPDVEAADGLVLALLTGGAAPSDVAGSAHAGSWRWELRGRLPLSESLVWLEFPHEQIGQVVGWLGG